MMCVKRPVKAEAYVWQGDLADPKIPRWLNAACKRNFHTLQSGSVYGNRINHLDSRPEEFCTLDHSYALRSDPGICRTSCSAGPYPSQSRACATLQAYARIGESPKTTILASAENPS
jgi:hypothetical protein